MRFKVKYNAYLLLISNGKEPLKTSKEYAEKLGVNYATIRRWSNKIDWEAIKTERRKAYALRMLPVDEAMFKEACKGNVAAAQYVAQRFDGWVPTTAQLGSKEADEDLIERAKSIKEQLIVGTGSDKPGTSPTATA